MPDLRDAEVTTIDGESRSIGDLVGGRPAVIVFLRHFGCVGCSQHTTELAPRALELAQVGVALVFVGNGTKEQLAGFVERHDLGDRQAIFVTDPTLDAYRAAGLERSLWGVVGPRGIAGQIRAIGEGHLPGRIRGDNRQQGGAVVLDADGRIVFRHASEAIGDNASGADLVGAALRAALSKREVRGVV